MNVIVVAIFLLGLFYSYQRYVPIRHVPSIDLSRQPYNINDKNIVYVDVRAYQDATHKPVKGAFNLPYAYLKRHYKQIKSKQVVDVASDPVLKNLSIRYLKTQGFQVVGYHLIKS